ncbi:uncharacterized protein UBRO_20829 [Ustilago bromivora]|uniref:Uncharacterized protein n=1 Tax=Ustilago bromivora TaxID=307758 RepID=A0A1K0GUR1_9BASI|nr:uncharacterized protein UBRO_20829 [Ustilago bromivora]
MQHGSFLDVLDPAILAEENSNLNSIPEAEPSVANSEELPLVLVEGNLDYMMAEAQAQASEPEDMQMENPTNSEPDTSSGEVPDPFPIPSLDLQAQEAEVEELLDAEEEGGTLLQLPEPELELELELEPEPEPELVQQPTPTLEPNLDLADVQDMPVDGIVVLLPAVDAGVPNPQQVVPLPTRLL